MKFLTDCKNYRMNKDSEGCLSTYNLENEKHFQKCMNNKIAISQSEFLSMVDFASYDDEYECGEDYLNDCEREDSTTGYYTGILNGVNVAFFQTSGFEFFFKS